MLRSLLPLARFLSVAVALTTVFVLVRGAHRGAQPPDPVAGGARSSADFPEGGTREVPGTVNLSSEGAPSVPYGSTRPQLPEEWSESGDIDERALKQFFLSTSKSGTIEPEELERLIAEVRALRNPPSLPTEGPLEPEPDGFAGEAAPELGLLSTSKSGFVDATEFERLLGRSGSPEPGPAAAAGVEGPIEGYDPLIPVVKETAGFLYSSKNPNLGHVKLLPGTEPAQTADGPKP